MRVQIIQDTGESIVLTKYEFKDDNNPKAKTFFGPIDKLWGREYKHDEIPFQFMRDTSNKEINISENDVAEPITAIAFRIIGTKNGSDPRDRFWIQVNYLTSINELNETQSSLNQVGPVLILPVDVPPKLANVPGGAGKLYSLRENINKSGSYVCRMGQYLGSEDRYVLFLHTKYDETHNPTRIPSE